VHAHTILGTAQVGSGDVSARVDGGREGDCRITHVAPLVKDQLDARGVKVIGRVRSIARVDTRQDRHVDGKSAGAGLACDLCHCDYMRSCTLCGV